MEYHFFRKNEIIFKEGSIGKTFYIILKGNVGIYKNNANINPQNGNEENKIIDSPEISHYSINMTPDLKEIQTPVSFIETNRNKLKEIAELTKGSSFGEFALLENKPRAATIICKKDSHFAVLDQKSFKKILGKLKYIFFFLIVFQ